MYLFHASDLHLTHGITCSSGRFGDVALTNGQGHAFTRLTGEALVSHFAKMIRSGRRDWHLVITGDVTDVGAEEELALAREILAPIWDPRFLTVVPGNHDCASEAAYGWATTQGLTVPWTFQGRRQAFADTFGELMQSSRGFREYEWPFVKILHDEVALVGLDSTDDNVWQATGKLYPWQLEALDEILERLDTDARYMHLGVAVALHHSPLAVDPDMLLEDGDELLELCAGRVTCILNGHAHEQDFDWDGTDGDLPVLQVDSPAIDEEDDPTDEHHVVPVHVYRFRGGELRSLDDVDEVEIELGPSLRARHALFRETYGDAFRRATACMGCAGPVAPEMKGCPWCSQERAPNASLPCSECNGPVLEGHEYCPWCGIRFEGENEGRYDSGRMVAECPACDSGVEAYHGYCANCGERQEPPDDGHPEMCTDCEWPVDRAVYLHCPWCQTVL